VARRTLRREPIVPTASCPPGWAWLFAGIFIGIFVSFLFYLREIAPNIPVATHESVSPTRVVEAPVKTEVPAKKVTQTRSLSRTPTEVVPLEPAEPQPEPERPPFEFYNAVTDAKATAPSIQPKPAHLTESETFSEESPLIEEPIPVKAPGSYTLQVGSFRDAEAAEGLKAHLALLGISSYVQHAMLNGSDSWYRVRIGPISDLKVLNRIRSQLATNRLAANITKENYESNRD
jgi:cell division protein FtsN